MASPADLPSMAWQLWPHHTNLPPQSTQWDDSSSLHLQPMSDTVGSPSLLSPWSMLPHANSLCHGSFFSHAAPPPPPPPPPPPAAAMPQQLPWHRNSEGPEMGPPFLTQQRFHNAPALQQRKLFESIGLHSPSTPNSSLSSSSNDAHHEELPPSLNHGVSTAANDNVEEDEGSYINEESELKREKKPMKKAQKRIRQPRIALVTKTDVDQLEDGYRWRKYGQKAVKKSPYPRSYYRCTYSNCSVKKRVERLSEDPSFVITTYEGQHIHRTPASLRGSTEPRIEDVGHASFNPSPFPLQIQPSQYWPAIDFPILQQQQQCLQSMQSPPAPSIPSDLVRRARDYAAALPQQPQSAASLLHGCLLQDVLDFESQKMM